MKINWVLEREIFNDNHDRLAEAAIKAGHQVIAWDDRWWENHKWPALKDDPTIFHGSLENADKIALKRPWCPGAFCHTHAFECHNWYEKAGPWLLHEKWTFSTVSEFISRPERFLVEIGSPKRFFVRPDSPLKPFSGRVLQSDTLSFEALDYGFYYDDRNLPIVIAPVSAVGQEWRFVVAGHKVLTSSSYEAANRTESNSERPAELLEYAKEIAEALLPPDPIYILDVCDSRGKFKLIEMNPFSGADLYGCDREVIVSAVEGILTAPKDQ